jgi:hypothetical protein
VGLARGSYTQAAQLDPHNADVGKAMRQLAEVNLWQRLRGWWRNNFLS